MSSTVQRERAAARAKLERQMAEKLENARRRKQRNTVLSAFGAMLLLAGIVFWVVKMVGPSKENVTADPSPQQTPGPAQCVYSAEDIKANPKLKDVGTPETGPAVEKGTQTMTMTTGLGVIEVEVNTAKAPCAARSMTYLASKKFFDNTKCHRLTTAASFKVLQCGDPTGSSQGGPAYKMAEENMPNVIDPMKAYPVGTIAMAKTKDPGSTGSQFFILYGESNFPEQTYTILGKITKGLDLIQKAAEAGAVDSKGKKVDDGTPKTEVLIKTLTMTPATKS